MDNLSTKAVATADNPDAQRLQDTVDHLRRMRYFRKQYDQRRALFYRQYVSQRDSKYFPDNITPRSNTFIPYPYSNVETVVDRVMNNEFGFEPWFECKGRNSQDDQAAEKMGIVLHYLMKQSEFIQVFEALVRNICIYGHAAIKVDWNYDYETVTYKEPILAQQPVMQPEIDPHTGQPKMGPQGPIMHPVLDPQTGQPAMQPVIDPSTNQPVVIGVRPAQKKVPKMRPKYTAIDVYDLLIDPDGGIIAHLTERTMGQMKREQEMSLAMDPTRPLYSQEGLQKLDEKVRGTNTTDPDSVIVRIAELWNDYDNTCTVVTFGEDAEAMSWKDLRASYRAASLSAYKRKVYGGDPILLYSGENQFNHHRIPILHTSYTKLPNELYGLGVIEPISDLTESLNKFVNMIVDNWNLGINRRYAYDVNADIDHAALNNFNVPGGKVGVNGKPNEVLFPLPIHTPEPGDYTLIDLYKGVIEMTSGISDFYSKGMGSPVGNRTATGINSIQQESNFRFQAFIRNLELDILVPLLSMSASLVMQFITNPVEVMITNDQVGIRKGVLVSPEEYIGNFTFDMVAANYANNKIIRQRNVMALMQMFMETPYFNTRPALIELAKLFEIRNIDRFLKSDQQVQMEQQQAQAQQIDMMIFEAMLGIEGDARKLQSKPIPGGKDERGRPRSPHMPEGKLPGAGLTSVIRQFAQSHGATAFGLEGLGELGGK